MRGLVPQYEMQTAQTLAEALRLLNAAPAGTWRPFAGGTDLMVQFEAGRLQHRRFVSLLDVPELRGISVNDHGLRIGASATYSQIRDHKAIQEHWPMLASAARETGAIAIQNRGTIGGNIANASPAADSPPALLAYDTRLELVSPKGARQVALCDFFLGYKDTALHTGEIIAAVIVPSPSTAQLTHHYRKVGTRKAQAISKVCVAAVGRLNAGKYSDIKIAMASVAPIPLRLKNVELILNNHAPSPETRAKAIAALKQDIRPIDDIRSNADYRLTVSGNLLGEFLDLLDGQHPAR